MRKNGRGLNPALTRFTLSYLSLIAVLLVMGVATYGVSANVVAAQTTDGGALMLAQSAKRLENALAEADAFAATLVGQPAVRQLSLYTGRVGGAGVYSVWETISALTAFPGGSRLFNGYQLYFRDLNCVLEPSNAYMDPDGRYGLCYRYGDWRAEDWRANVLDAPRRVVLLPAREALACGTEAPMLVYARDLTYLTRQRGKILFFINEAAMLGLFDELFDLPVTCLTLLDPYGAVLSQKGEPPASFDAAEAAARAAAGESGYQAGAGRDRSVCALCVTENYGWTIVATMPYAAVAARAGTVLKPMLLCVAALMLLGLLIAAFSFHSNRKPLASTLRLLSESTGDGFLRKGLRQLDQAVHQLVQNNTLLEQRLEAQHTQLRAALAASLESGDALEDAEIETLLSHVGARPEGERFRGVYLALPDDGAEDGDALARGDLRRALAAELLAPYAPALSILSLKDRATFILLYARGEDDAPDAETDFFRGVWQAMQAAGLEAVIYLGAECGSLRYLPYSLWTARRARAGAEDVGFLVWASEDMDDNDYAYTDQHEKRLASLAALGDEAGVMALLEELRAANTRNARLSLLGRQMLIFRMLGTLGTIRGNLALSEELLRSPHKLGLDAFFSLLEAHYREVCRSNRARRSEQTARTAADILRYIDAQYADYALTLTSAASRFGMTAKHLSAFLYEKAGVHFSQYLEQLRVRKANELLLNTPLTTEEIARRIGYANGKTFRRAYIRVSGVTPSAYRKANAGSAGAAGAEAGDAGEDARG